MYPESILPMAAHIPHAGTQVPEAVRSQFLHSPDALWREILRVTDWYTDELFMLPGMAVTQTPISRVVVDLERFTDDQMEEKARFGQGVIYTHDSLGDQIRGSLPPTERQLLLDTYYTPWHLQLQLNIQQQLARWGHCLLLDCHSFPATPLEHEDDRGVGRPDIGLGICENTPAWLIDGATSLFMTAGYTVGVNFPYAGCLVPHTYRGNVQVPAIMIEINRKLYLEAERGDTRWLREMPDKSENFERLRNDIWRVIVQLAHEMVCRVPGVMQR